MEFGKISNIEDVNWSIPEDVPTSLEFLKTLPRRNEPRFFIGTPAWGHKEWIGKIYPPKTKASDFLSFYSKNFSTIEFNTVHYRIPTEAQVSAWVSQVPQGFRFCPKVFQGISHGEGLIDKKLLQEWFRFCDQLKEYLGPCFIQFPPHFDYSRKASLFYFLEQWPKDLRLSLEFRHPSWFQGGKVLPALEKYLQQKNIGLVITDVAGRRDVLHTSISSSFLLLRFIGNNLHASDYLRSKKWAERLSQWAAQGLHEVYFFVHEPDDINSPEMAQQVILDLNEEAGANLSPLQWVHS